SELLPSAPGGVTQTRIAVRPESKGSSWLMVADDGPAYRIYQVIERFGVMTRVVSWAGAEHILLGTISFGNFNFESDPSFPLHFKYVQDVGYVHLCGRGTVTTPEGLKHSIGGAKRLDDFIGEIMAEDQLTREGASEALGWLAKTQAEKDKAVPALVKALKDEAMEVRRNAASSLGKIGDLRAQEALKTALQDKDEWVQQVVADALKKIEQGTSESSS
ncbi:MAG: HEAT repeat domain-containing protein, partial [Deltaproteobacteria bacterium]|nr:HEAT repeat domain-containing protein [Deltaproteobacteria bacterium]